MGLRKGGEYYLMHKDIRVCLMGISDDGVLGSVRLRYAGIGFNGFYGKFEIIKYKVFAKR